MLFVSTPLQPPVAVAVASHVAKAVFTAACVWQAATVVLVGQVRVGGTTTEMASVSPSSSPMLPLFGVESGSLSALPVTWAKLVMVPVPVTVAWKVSVADPPLAKKRFCHFKPVVAGAPLT